MSSEEEQEVFEITDFTTATHWERFIARIEEIIHEWKLPLNKPKRSLKKGELTTGQWTQTRELLMFSTFQFTAIYHHLNAEPLDTDVEETIEEDEGEQMPYCLSDMMSRENDFPPRAHCLVRWYGLRDFVVIQPAKTSDAIMTEDRTKMLLSSCFIAINNTNCQVPIFVQLQQMREKYFLGACEGGGIRTHFEMVHLQRPFPQYSHLSGLLSLFKSKLSSSPMTVPSVSVSIRFTYILNDWSPYSWPQPPPDIDELGEDVTPKDIGRLPCGALEDPISEFHLSTTWPYLSEEAVIDNDVHSDLNPMLAPKWSVRIQVATNPNCSMSEYLKVFANLAHGYESLNQLIGNIADDLDETGDTPHVTQALDKLANPTGSVPLPTFPSILAQAQARRMEMQESPPINEDVLIKILQFIFPDSAPTPEEQDSDEYKDTVGSVTDLGNIASFSKVQEHMKSFKSAPPGSLTWHLALAMCHVNHSYGGLPAVSQLWQDFLLEMRHRWENNYTLPCLEAGPPNMTHCLLHQKLQMLNCCIQRKKAREWHYTKRSCRNSDQDKAAEDSSQKGSPALLSEEDEDEFFECSPSNSSPPSDAFKATKLGEGRLRQLGNMTIIDTGEPLYIPITQEPAPVTEDLLAEQAEVLVQLGTNPEGAALRARMQSACLMSDMEAFKAANPKSKLEDFVRWYSPRDLLEEETVCESTGKKTTKYRLSARMVLPGNMWLEAWESARPVPAKRQKRLFDDTKEAEKVLHFLASARIVDIVTFMIPMLIQCAILQIADEAEDCPKSLISKLEETAVKTAKVTRSPEPKYEPVLSCLYQAEIIVAQLQSLSKKFCHLENANNNTSRTSSLSGRSHSIDSSGKAMDGNKPSKKQLADNTEITRFILDLLDNSEVDVNGAGKGVVGKRIQSLFSDAQKAAHLIMDDQTSISPNVRSVQSELHKTVPDFPHPSGKEFILRTTFAKGSSYRTEIPQRMYCVLMKEEFRLAGAFSSDTTFL